MQLGHRFRHSSYPDTARPRPGGPCPSSTAFKSIMSHGPHTYTLIYDGECGICRRSVKWIRQRDEEERIELLPYQDPAVPERFPEIPQSDMERAMQLVARDGARWEGARAAEELLAVLPRWRVAAPLFKIPGVRRVAERVYRWVASNRRRLGCGEHCPLPDAPSSSDSPD